MRELLSKGFSASDPDLSAALQDSMMQLSVVEAPFLKQHKITYAKHLLPRGPRVYYLAMSSEKHVINLTANLAAWNEMLQNDHVHLKSIAEASAYMLLCFEVLHSRSNLCYLVNSVADLRFRPNLEDALLARCQAIQAKRQDQLHAIQAVTTLNGFEVVYFQVQNRQLERVTTMLASNGTFEQKVEVLEEDMPTVWGL